MKILEDNFNSKGFNLSLVKREGDVAIYKKTLENSETDAHDFEVIAIKRHNGYEIAGIKMPPAEMYPSNTQWGDWAYTCTSREDADKRFVQLTDKLTNYTATSVLASGEKRKRGRPRKSNILPAPPAEINLTENQMEVV